MKVRLITKEKVLYEGEAQSVVAPAANGQLGVLARHAPLMASLGLGVLKIATAAEKIFFAVVGGFLQVKDNILIVLADKALRADTIDRIQAEEQVARLKLKLDTGKVSKEDKLELWNELAEVKLLAHAARLAEEEQQGIRT
ncbi:MAG TPA: ATP synthase F1 subunit epsilon [Candidatus Glassbacteria bacterium]|nr:ATP synthase F1 subunit epsilon [Candidatus Glassbacteria bacterium]